MILNVNERDAYFQEFSITLVAGVSTTIAVNYWGTPSSVSATVYKVTSAGESDVTATVMPAGSVTISGYTATLKPLTALVGGYQYVLALTGTVGGDVSVKKLIIEVQTISQAG